METRDYLKDELKRLNRIHDLLENEVNKSQFTSIAIEEQIQKNTLAMCEIAKVM